MELELCPHTHTHAHTNLSLALVLPHLISSASFARTQWEAHGMVAWKFGILRRTCVLQYPQVKDLHHGFRAVDPPGR